MGFKRMDNSLGFADLALASSLKHNRSLKTLKIRYSLLISYENFAQKLIMKGGDSFSNLSI